MEAFVESSTDPVPSATTESRGVDASPRESGPIARIARRVAYWSPVFLALALFGQIAFLGLRPALAESRRLATADVALRARELADRTDNAALSLQLAARNDPVYRERQRRAALLVPAQTPAGG